ncbi:hypothetical protein MRX96_024114 [Rhipicephalus microplus]
MVLPPRVVQFNEIAMPHEAGPFEEERELEDVACRCDHNTVRRRAPSLSPPAVTPPTLEREGLLRVSPSSFKTFPTLKSQYRSIDVECKERPGCVERNGSYNASRSALDHAAI